MSEAVVAKRYADALFQLATEKGLGEELISDLQTLKQVFQNDDKINDFVTHPRVTNEQKVQLIDASFGKLNKFVVNTLKLLVERHRTESVPAIVDEYIDLYNEANGIAEATVYSTRALTDDEQAKLVESFKKRFNKQQVTIENKIDPSLLGGMKIKVGNTIYDGSIQGKLNRMRNNIVSETI